MSRAPKPLKGCKKSSIHTNLQIKCYLVKHRRKPTGNNPPNRRRCATNVTDPDWEDTLRDDTDTEDTSRSINMASIGVNTDLAPEPTTAATSEDLH